jgi:riboflavin kinase, archaea type
MMLGVEIHGRLVRGLGEAPAFTQLPWVVEQCRTKLGFEPYPGTVNLEVLSEDMASWQELKAQAGVLLVPPDPAFCDAGCQPVTIDGKLGAATITPHVEGYPADKLELLAPCNVMQALQLSFGQEVTLTVRTPER